MKKTLMTTAAIAVALMTAGTAQAAPKAQDFVQKAAVANLFEIQSSQLALQNSQSDAIKKFAQHMIDDHTKAGDSLKATLSTANIDPSTVPTTLDAKHQKIEDKLAAAKPADFDKTYIKDQSSAHDEAISLFKSYSEKGDNAALKNFAAQTLPTLQEHKQEVDALKKEGMDKMASGGSTMPMASSSQMSAPSQAAAPSANSVSATAPSSGPTDTSSASMATAPAPAASGSPQ